MLVADAFDALTTNRVYRPGRTAALALEEIRAHVGTQFCARVVEQLEALHREEPETLAIEEELAGVAFSGYAAASRRSAASGSAAPARSTTGSDP